MAMYLHTAVTDEANMIEFVPQEQLMMQLVSVLQVPTALLMNLTRASLVNSHMSNFKQESRQIIFLVWAENRSFAKSTKQNKDKT